MSTKIDEREERTQKMLDFLGKRGLALKEKRHAKIFNNGNYKYFYNYIFERINKK